MLYAHQKKIIDEDKKKTLLALGTGSGKSRTALMLASGSTLVIMPKTQFMDQNWERELNKIKGDKLPLRVTALATISKEQFKKSHEMLPAYETVIIDEAHTVCGVQPIIRQRNRKPIPKASQIFEAVYMYLKRTSPERVYLCTATAARNPMAVWAAATLLGHNLSWHSFRHDYYVRLPMPGREVWRPQQTKEAKEALAKAVRSIGYVGRLEDWFDVPPQIDKFVHCPLTADEKRNILELPLTYPDPLALIGKTHQAEQGTAKLEAIEDLLLEFGKVLVFARYRDQIDMIAEHFKTTYVITGDTKDRKELIAKAEAAPSGVVVVQAQIATGFELPSIHCVIFASMSYSYVDYMQARGRVLRANKLGKKLYVHLYSGKIDGAVIKCMQGHSDFSEKLYAQRGKISDPIQLIRPADKGHRVLRAQSNDEELDPF